MTKLFVIAFSVFIGISCKSTKINEIHYLPLGYTGSVFVIFDQQDGSQIIKENGSIIYKIPKSGILKTQDNFKAGTYSNENVKFFYIDSLGNKTQLFFKNTGDWNSDSIVVFPFSISSSRIDGKDFPHIMEYYVGIPSEFNRQDVKKLTIQDIENWNK